MSQCADILAHCKSGRHLTSLVAMNKYGCVRLSERIRELEQRGYHFQRQPITIVNRHGHKCRFVAYSLED